MKVFVILLLLIDILLAVFCYLLREQINSLRKRASAQDDIISRIAGKQFEDSKEIATLKVSEQLTDKELADRITKLANSLAYQQRTIDRVRAYAYNEATKEDEDESTLPV